MSLRIRAFDIARGFAIISMVCFHYCYDLVYLSGVDLPWFRPPLQDVWRASISWVFLLIAGCMCSFSSNNLKRALRYGTLALAIYVVTTIASVDAPISFGIIYCMAASTFVEWLLERLGHKPWGLVAALVLFLLFVTCLHVPNGYVGWGSARLCLPSEIYSTQWLSWLGLPGPGFVSGDYYPLVPFVLLFLSGSALGWWFGERGYPTWFASLEFGPLEAVGRHPLLIYVLHQPLLLLICRVSS